MKYKLMPEEPTISMLGFILGDDSYQDKARAVYKQFYDTAPEAPRLTDEEILVLIERPDDDEYIPALFVLCRAIERKVRGEE